MYNESEWLVCGPHWSTEDYGSMEVRWRSNSPWSTGLGCNIRDALSWQPVGTAALNWSPAHPSCPHWHRTPWEELLLSLPGLARAALKAILVGWLLSYPWVWNSSKPWDHREPGSESSRLTPESFRADTQPASRRHYCPSLHLLVCLLLRHPTYLTCSKHHRKQEKIKESNRASQISESGKGGKQY